MPAALICFGLELWLSTLCQRFCSSRSALSASSLPCHHVVTGMSTHPEPGATPHSSLIFHSLLSFLFCLEPSQRATRCFPAMVQAVRAAFTSMTLTPRLCR